MVRLDSTKKMMIIKGETITYRICDFQLEVVILNANNGRAIMKKVLVSACLMGEQVRYDNEFLPNLSPVLKEWDEQGLIISVCPEVAGGLPVPRPPAEIQGGDGIDVVLGTAKVIDINGEDVTSEYFNGAEEALRLVEENGIKCAILKAWSPSCGSKLTYDGSFSESLKVGQGVTAALLVNKGIKVFNEDEIDLVVDLIDE
jgi:uncharacterized protein YbbK (DUF523 family)